MRHSKFKTEEKIQILRERIENRMTIKAICDKYGISISTYYIWSSQVGNFSSETTDNNLNLPEDKLKQENTNLKRLYISLSEHNYELSRLLIK